MHGRKQALIVKRPAHMRMIQARACRARGTTLKAEAARRRRSNPVRAIPARAACGAAAYGRSDRGPDGPRTARRGVAPHPRQRDRLGFRARPPIMLPATSPQNWPGRARRPGERPAVRAVFSGWRHGDFRRPPVALRGGVELPDAQAFHRVRWQGPAREALAVKPRAVAFPGKIQVVEP